MAQESLSHEQYTVGWICALPLEMAAAKAMLEEIHPRLPQPLHDHNSYVLGEIAGHNVAVACLPSGIYGTTSASVVAAQMLSTFPSIRFGLMVGIGGGAPCSQADIRLGDVVVSKPTGLLPGVVQYDYGKTIASRCFERTGTRNLPPHVLLTALSEVQSSHMTGHIKFHEFLTQGLQSVGGSLFVYPGREKDQLFKAAYVHGASENCISCDPSQLVSRDSRPQDTPEIHYGTIASGNQVMKNGQIRDQLAQSLGILCFEMEAAGLMDHFPCLVIRGICDYSDSHKNKIWQGYEALSAAAYAKELLLAAPVAQMQHLKPATASKDEDPMFYVRLNTINVPRSPCFVGREKELIEIRERLENTSNLEAAVTLQGSGGLGKTQLALTYAMRHSNQYSAIFWLNATSIDSVQSSFLEAAKRILRDHPDLRSWREIVENNALPEAVTAVKDWLSIAKNNSWLLIYDGYDTPKFEGCDERTAFELKSFLPEARQGHIIVTTTTYQASIGHCLQVRRLDFDVGIQILSQVSRREGLHDDRYAKELVNNMDGLPLAITSAGAYLERTSMSIPDYLELHRNSWASLQRKAPRLSSYADKIIYSTWEVSLRQIRQINRLSGRILELWVSFDHQDIWFELLHNSGSIIGDKLSFHEAMSVICEYGLAELGSLREDIQEPRGYRMHRCVHTWLSYHFGIDRQTCFAVLKFIWHHQPIPFMSFDLVQRILPHADRCCDHLFDAKVTYPEHYAKLLDLASFYKRAGSGSSALLAAYVKAIGIPPPGIRHFVNAEKIYKLIYEKTQIDGSKENVNQELLLLVEEQSITGLICVYGGMTRHNEQRQWQLLALDFYRQKRWGRNFSCDEFVSYLWIKSEVIRMDEKRRILRVQDLLVYFLFLCEIWTEPTSFGVYHVLGLVTYFGVPVLLELMRLGGRLLYSFF